MRLETITGVLIWQNYTLTPSAQNSKIAYAFPKSGTGVRITQPFPTERIESIGTANIAESATRLSTVGKDCPCCHL